jgi:sterol carrier protein 2
MTTDSPKLYEQSAIELTGADMTRRAAQAVYKASGINPGSGKIKVIELHDCFAANEVSQ